MQRNKQLGEAILVNLLRTIVGLFTSHLVSLAALFCFLTCGSQEISLISRFSNLPTVRLEKMKKIGYTATNPIKLFLQSIQSQKLKITVNTK